MRMSGHWFVLNLGLAVTGCSASDAQSSASGLGGGNGIGGANQGGIVGSGGTSVSAPATAVPGATGGSAAAGGTGSTETVASTGGRTNGSNSVTGGAKNAGGSVATGSTIANAGSVATGGTTANVGSKATGGTTANVGSKATGGTIANAGSVATGGTTANVGSKATGGTIANADSVATGGTTANVGSKASGGTTANAGTSSTGGTTTAGGTTAAGGGSPGSDDELPGSACTRQFKTPTFAELKTNAKMPDPFTFLDGTKVTTREDWVCRQKEIGQLAQAFIYGPKPPKPESLTATYSSGTLTLNMTNAGRTWNLSVPIKVPSGTGPFPAMFDVDAGAPSGVASIGTGLTWLTGNVAAAGSGRGTSGGFYTFFPDSKATGSLMAWAWVASRIVDGLKATTGHNIDTTKMYGLGCSRNGKTAATMALFDQRIAMVAMQSPGSGTTSGWRIAQAQTGSVQTASQIYGETTWMGEAFSQFGNNVNKLPIDQHEVLALAWPRPILVREGDADSWNCPICVFTTLKYTQMVYDALGDKDSIGFTHYVGGHCESGGTAWTNTYNAFLKHYILPADGTTSTASMFTEGKFTFDAAKWQDGTLSPIP